MGLIVGWQLWEVVSQWSPGTIINRSRRNWYRLVSMLKVSPGRVGVVVVVAVVMTISGADHVSLDNRYHARSRLHFRYRSSRIGYRRSATRRPFLERDSGSVCYTSKKHQWCTDTSEQEGYAKQLQDSPDSQREGQLKDAQHLAQPRRGD